MKTYLSGRLHPHYVMGNREWCLEVGWKIKEFGINPILIRVDQSAISNNFKDCSGNSYACLKESVKYHDGKIIEDDRRDGWLCEISSGYPSEHTGYIYTLPKFKNNIRIIERVDYDNRFRKKNKLYNIKSSCVLFSTELEDFFVMTKRRREVGFDRLYRVFQDGQWYEYKNNVHEGLAIPGDEHLVLL